MLYALLTKRQHYATFEIGSTQTRLKTEIYAWNDTSSENTEIFILLK